MIDFLGDHNAGKPVGRRGATTPETGLSEAPVQPYVPHIEPLVIWTSAPEDIAPRTGAQHVQLAIKRGIDIGLGAVILAVLFPALLAVATLVRLSGKGPVIFRQTRAGLNGRQFTIYKFRTMHHGASGITALGMHLRRLSIDELPQLLNVIKGDMSLVGPRPHVPGMEVCGTRYDALIPQYRQRETMRPGLTGLAQAHGLRGPIADCASAWARIEYDVAYVRQFSLLLDLRIVWMTIHREFPGGTGQ